MSEGPRPSRSADARRIQELERELRRKDAALAETAALLVLKKKVQAIWGDEDAITDPRPETMILALIEAAVRAGAAVARRVGRSGLSVRTVERWREGGETTDGRHGPHHRPANALTPGEHRTILAVVKAAAYRDLSPHQIVPHLADAGRYLASESTMYRILRAEALLQYRGRAKAPERRPPRAHLATGPNQLWSWDITYLKTPVRGVFQYLYLMLDVWSRRSSAGRSTRRSPPSRPRRSSSRRVARSGAIPRASCCTPTMAAR